MSRLVVISPHLDDAVFSCGTLISAASLVTPVTVMTVCAGIPGHFDHATSLDFAAGFLSSKEAMQTRRAEDAEACRILGAQFVHLDVLDSQYVDDDGSRVEIMRGAIKAGLYHIGLSPEWALDLDAPKILAPVGIRHVDHKNVALACMGIATLLYQELPYRVLWPGNTTPSRLVMELPTSAAKQAAIFCYRSQLGDGPAGAELSAPELYHYA